jgi:hypothetical protein
MFKKGEFYLNEWKKGGTRVEKEVQIKVTENRSKRGGCL